MPTVATNEELQWSKLNSYEVAALISLSPEEALTLYLCPKRDSENTDHIPFLLFHYETWGFMVWLEGMLP